MRLSRILLTVGGGGGSSVTPGAGSLTLTGYAPTIIQPISISPSAGSLTLTGYAPASTLSVQLEISPAAGGLTITGYSPLSEVSTTLTVTITLVDESDVPITGLTSLKWCFFDQVTPDLFVAPTDQGSSGTTNGSGVFTVSLPNSLLTTGNVGWLVVTNSDGTTTQSPAHSAFCGPVAVT